VAYRQLCAVTFAVLGWVTVGCGAGTASHVGTDASEEQPPANTDAPPSNSDQATNPDTTPANPDKPPTSADAPAGTGGGLSALCKRICSSLASFADDCNSGMDTIGMGDICSADVDCQIPGDIPCQNEIADAFDCVFTNLAAICSADNQGPGNGDAAQAEPCRDVGEAYNKCARANGQPGTGTGNGNGNGNGNGTAGGPGNPAAACTTAGGCECGTPCLNCLCEAGSDLTASQACGTGACAL
jgi:hypothetical protein